MTSLESLTIMQCDATSFIRALFPTASKIPCPTLEKLTIRLKGSDGSCVPGFVSVVEQRASHQHKFEKIVLVFDFEVPEFLDVPTLEVKVDHQPLFWDQEKRLWRYLNTGESYIDVRKLRALSSLPRYLSLGPRRASWHDSRDAYSVLGLQ